jgi:hypothetical protein
LQRATGEATKATGRATGEEDRCANEPASDPLAVSLSALSGTWNVAPKK